MTHADSVLLLARAMRRTAVPPGLATVAIAAAVAGLVAGVEGTLGAVAGGAAAFGSSWFTLLLMRLTAPLPVSMVMAAALGGYLTKVSGLLLVMLLVRQVPGVHVPSVAWTFLAAVLVWAVAEAVAFRRTRMPTLVTAEE